MRVPTAFPNPIKITDVYFPEKLLIVQSGLRIHNNSVLVYRAWPLDRCSVLYILLNIF